MFFGLLLFVSGQFSIKEVWAKSQKCQCIGKSFDSRWVAADAVFIGKVIDISPLEGMRRVRPEEPPVVVTIKVKSKYKMPWLYRSNKFVLHTSLTNYTCGGYPFKNQEDYLVFAYLRNENEATAESLYRFDSGTYHPGGLCGGTKLLSIATDEIKELEKKAGSSRHQSVFSRLFK